MKNLSGMELVAGAQVDGVDISAHDAEVTTKHLPTQAAAAGKLLTSNGSVASWLAPRESIYLSAGGAIPSIVACSAPASFQVGATNKVSMYGLGFATSPDQFADWSFPMPNNWDGGTVTAQFYWTAAAGTVSGTTIFKLAARVFPDSDSLDQAMGTAVGATDTILALDDLHKSPETTAITVAGTAPAGGDWIVFRVQRDTGNDTFAGVAQLLGVKVFYGTDSMTE